MVNVDVKKVGRIPDGGGWRVHGKGRTQAKAVAVATAAGTRAGYVYLHSAVDGYLCETSSAIMQNPAKRQTCSQACEDPPSDSVRSSDKLNRVPTAKNEPIPSASNAGPKLSTK